MGMGPRVLASGSNQVPASISVIKKGTALHPSHEPVLTSTKAPSSPLFPQKVGRALLYSFRTRIDGADVPRLANMLADFVGRAPAFIRKTTEFSAAQSDEGALPFSGAMLWV